MNRLFASTAIAGTLLLYGFAARAADVGVSVSLGEPGFFGQINIGSAPPPQVVNTQPILIGPAPVGEPPIYLRVPPSHRADWARYCRQYNACNRPVYFVNDRWYKTVFVPHYRAHRDDYRGREAGREERRVEERRDDRREERREDRR